MTGWRLDQRGNYRELCSVQWPWQGHGGKEDMEGDRRRQRNPLVAAAQSTGLNRKERTGRRQDVGGGYWGCNIRYVLPFFDEEQRQMRKSPRAHTDGRSLSQHPLCLCSVLWLLRPTDTHHALRFPNGLQLWVRDVHRPLICLCLSASRKAKYL